MRPYTHLEHALRIVSMCADLLAIADEYVEHAPLLLCWSECTKGASQFLCKEDGVFQFMHREESVKAREEHTYLKGQRCTLRAHL